jgi:hypothetical protein
MAEQKEWLSKVQQYGWALQWVPEALKTPELCLAACQQDGEALQWVPESLKTPELCLSFIGKKIDPTLSK